VLYASGNFDVFVSTSEQVPTNENCDEQFSSPKTIEIADSKNQRLFTSQYIFLTFDSRQLGVVLQIRALFDDSKVPMADCGVVKKLAAPAKLPALDQKAIDKQ
jgi:hypothetical protein